MNNKKMKIINNNPIAIYSKTCKLCNHCNRDDIEKGFIAGIGLMELSRQYKLNYKCIKNHMNKHYQPNATVIIAKKDIKLTIDGLKELIEDNFNFFNEAKKIFYDGTSEGLMMIGSIMDQERKYIETSIKLLDKIDSMNSNNLLPNNNFIHVEFVDKEEEEEVNES